MTTMTRGSIQGTWTALGGAVVLAALSSGVATAQPIALTAEAKTVDAERGSSIVVSGTAPAVPDGTVLRAKLTLFDKDGLEGHAEVIKGAYSLTFGPARKVLPGTYRVVVDLDARVQGRKVEEALAGRRVQKAVIELKIGDPEAAKAERARILAKFQRLLTALKGVHAGVLMWGYSCTRRSATEKIRYQGSIPAQVKSAVWKEWRDLTEGEFTNLPVIRQDLREFVDYCLVNYYPNVHKSISEIITTLDRCHASFTVAICKNLDRKPKAEIEAKGVFSLKELQRKIPALAKRTYASLGLEYDPWELVNLAKPESAKDIQGDLFRSSVSKFEIEKPGPDWMFDLGSPHPAFRLRLRPKKKVIDLIAGVEIIDHVEAESFKELAMLHEFYTRNRFPGFELVKARPITAPDSTMPKGVRPGFLMRYRVLFGKKPYYVLHHTLFCRWHKRTYSVVCFALEESKDEWIETFEGVNKTFKILDAPPKKPAAEDEGAGKQERDE